MVVPMSMEALSMEEAKMGVVYGGGASTRAGRKVSTMGGGAGGDRLRAPLGRER
jgi:hypothetical protein